MYTLVPIHGDLEGVTCLVVLIDHIVFSPYASATTTACLVDSELLKSARNLSMRAVTNLSQTGSRVV